MRSRATELGTDLSLAEEVQVLVSKALKVVERAGMIHFLCLGSFKRTGEDLCIWETIKIFEIRKQMIKSNNLVVSYECKLDPVLTHLNLVRAFTSYLCMVSFSFIFLSALL